MNGECIGIIFLYGLLKFFTKKAELHSKRKSENHQHYYYQRSTNNHANYYKYYEHLMDEWGCWTISSFFFFFLSNFCTFVLLRNCLGVVEGWGPLFQGNDLGFDIFFIEILSSSNSRIVSVLQQLLAFYPIMPSFFLQQQNWLARLCVCVCVCSCSAYAKY